MPPDLIVVLETSHAEHLKKIAEAAPVWIVNTPTNYAECERLWKCDPHDDYRENGAVTCFKAVDPENRLESLLGILSTLETHHGEVIADQLRFPNGFIVEIIGLTLSDDVISLLRENADFTSFYVTADGFCAVR